MLPCLTFHVAQRRAKKKALSPAKERAWGFIAEPVSGLVAASDPRPGPCRGESESHRRRNPAVLPNYPIRCESLVRPMTERQGERASFTGLSPRTGGPNGLFEPYRSENFLDDGVVIRRLK